MSLRIAVLGACPFPVPQGSQVLLKETARGLHARGHDVRLIVYGYGLGEEDIGLPVHRCAAIPCARKTAAGPSLLKPVVDLALVSTLRRVALEHRIDLVYAHNYEALAVAWAARVRPIVYHAHGALADELPHYFTGARWPARIGAFFDSRFPRRADRIIAPHAALADYFIRQGCSPGSVAVVPPPVDAAAFEPTPIEPGIPPVVYTGNLDAYQNLDLLVAAMQRVRQILPAARLIVATASTDTLPNAEHIPTPDFAALQRVLAQDCVIACPRVSWSGYPMKLLNAMAAGRASVACRSAAHPLEHARTGLVVPDNDPEAFAQALLTLLQDPQHRQTLAQNARQVAQTRHHPDTIATALEATCLSLFSLREI